uniref:Uncharacterized protein n=1 Tax=Leersia perrieri TaxID=77586 RepID=A0A0D9VF00_9ORYZ
MLCCAIGVTAGEGVTIPPPSPDFVGSVLNELGSNKGL